AFRCDRKFDDGFFSARARSRRAARPLMRWNCREPSPMGQTTSPALVCTTCPVICRLAGRHRNTTTPPTSSGSDGRGSRVSNGPALTIRSYAWWSPIDAVIGVLVIPGATEFTFTPWRPRSAADARVSPLIADFDAAYSAGALWARKAPLELRLTIRPPPP